MTSAADSSSPRVADLFQDAAHRRPQARALVVSADRMPITYRGLLGLVDDLAAQLARGGLRPGDRVALRAPSSAEFVVGLLAGSRVGLVVVPLDPALPVAEQHARIAAAGARVVLTDAGEREHAPFPCWSIALCHGGVSLHTTAAPFPPSPPPGGLRPDDAMIMFTGGTTGSPKMVPWTHDNIAGSLRGIIATYGLGPQDATVAVMPLFHGHGLMAALLSTLVSGGTVLLPAGGRFSAHTFWDDVRAAGATWFTAVPTIHRILLERSGIDRPRDGVTLRFVRSCSAALSAETAQAMRAEFGAPVFSAYGMTEATHQVASTRDDRAVTTGLVGRSSGVEIRIVGEDGWPRPPETVGEVWLRGRTVVRGYLANPGATAQTFTDGWLHTGDLGSLSEAGELTLRGRIKELINRAGEKISPERVEAVLSSHPNVTEAAVYGVADPLYGETVAAAVVPASSAAPSVAELAQFCRERLAPFEVPASIHVADELPHTAKGSVDRRAVAERFRR
ncbi:FadD7 family fatty acid--CoA ligase [Mycobacterium xenopi]|uniref:FadD7 family fatty acid--CoA ligase n=1 Tax=Mycobacterium xenopi TaxID=1789 RepID=UPI000A156B85|nr:FadD7 family fatty acid--CoA ligase [Mycobacterium xenopi]MDA3639069.1 FadD7 family fatty acid--CoA ligase [Mycobacterium xenopi]MDA3657441.1 FadD7 family fatty acid--CoA ligase [Mycobacterium xenopi]MDA3661333.1 FadD7 family fatty acid--CoA ligase [Mycobacterium xenopi]ORX20667.1 acyl-CoA synthetase [Mycobacterium xenopi]SPX79184.1 acyl-CoA synthetase [Mycobacterium xenopi]